MLLEAIVFVLVLLSAMMAAYAQFIFKKGVPKFRIDMRQIFDMLRARAVYTGLALYMVSLLIYLYALKFEDLSFVYPLFSTTFIFVMLIAKFRLNEPVTWMRAGGIALIVLGIGLVVLSG
ncbi:MAG: EamA family transporter [Candidatus Micrarchaeota archaeon]|nr:EamA family transporter [Candidatus Micrarchaeota archaeon]